MIKIKTAESALTDVAKICAKTAEGVLTPIVKGFVVSGSDTAKVLTPIYDNSEPEHVHSYTSEYYPATCVDSECTVYTCSCGHVYTEYGELAYGHSWDAGVVESEPTCAEDGVKVYTCTECGETDHEILYATGEHDGDCIESYPATCVAPAYSVYKCMDCEHEWTESYGESDPEAHDNELVLSDTDGNGGGFELYRCKLCGEETLIQWEGETYCECSDVWDTYEDENGNHRCSICHGLIA